MATDQKSSLSDDELAQSAPAIENELPTYRAISSRAVVSLIFGALALFCFAHLNFLVFAILAVVLGISANIAINRHPDMLTGRPIANAGIALGLIFGLISTTYTAVQSFVLTREAEKFARQYAEVLKQGSLGEILWFNMPPEMRLVKTPQQALEEFDTAKDKERMTVEMKLAGLQRLRKRLASTSSEQVRFVDIEGQGMDSSQGEISYYGLGLYEVQGPGSKDYPEKRQFALAIFKGKPKDRHYAWWVEDLQFPYRPKSYVVAPKPVDDGHGHHD